MTVCAAFYVDDRKLMINTADVGAYTYGLGHPMKPHRIRVTHDLVSAYDMLDKMHILVRISPLLLLLLKDNHLGTVETETRNSRSYELIPHRRIRPFPA